MRIKSVRLRNFRVFEDETVVLDAYTCLVGANGAGKSTVLAALNVFFGERSNATEVEALEPEDFRDQTKDVEITVTFHELTPPEHQALSDYARNGELVVTASAEAIGDKASAEVSQFGSRPGIPAFAPFFAAASASRKVEDLKAIHAGLRQNHPELPAWGRSKETSIDGVRQYEDSHPELRELIRSRDQFYGFQGTGKLAPFIQWVYVPAVKDARGEQSENKDNALGKLLKRAAEAKSALGVEIEAIRKAARDQYTATLQAKQSALDELSHSVAARVQRLAHPGASLTVRWADSEKSVSVTQPAAELVAGEHGFVGSVARLGHGLQRALVVALLEELAAHDKPGAPRLLMGFEEPELHQHPPQVRHVATVLQQLARANAQVVVTTHSPLFVTGDQFESVRLVRRPGGSAGARAIQPKRDAVSAILTRSGMSLGQHGAGLPAKLHTLLQPHASEIFFAPRIVLVEGVEDAAYLHTYLELFSGPMEQQYRLSGAHIVPANKKSELVRLLAITIAMEIPAFAIFDCDGDETHDTRRAHHVRDNQALFALVGEPTAVPFPAGDVFGHHHVAWRNDLASSVASDVADWTRFEQQATIDLGHAGDLHKNPLYIGRKLTLARDAGHEFPTLQRLVAGIVAWAEGPTPQPPRGAPDQ